MSASDGDLVLLYDGLCGFCDRTVQFVLRHDRRGVMRFAPLQGRYAGDVIRRHPGLAGVDSLILVEGGGSGERVAVRSDAVIGIGRYLGGLWGAMSLLRVVPRPIRDWSYDRFAKVRYRVFGKFESCPLPTADQRSRFILDA